MRRTFCDRCGAECRGKTGRLILVITHETSKREELGADECEPVDLCGGCTAEARATYGFRVAHYGGIGPDMTEARAVDIRADPPLNTPHP